MFRKMNLGREDMVENPTPRVPVCLVLDTSGSMMGNPIRELNSGVRTFFDAVRKDDVARYSAEISVVTFGGAVNELVGFAGVDRQTVPSLSAEGRTPMGAAVTRALDSLEARKDLYRSLGIDYYQPWMVLMTDGVPTDAIDSAASRTSEMIRRRRLTLFPIAVGNRADVATLRKFSPSRNPLRLKGLNFQQFFEWLSQSVSRVSQSIPGEKVDLDISSIDDWACL